MGKKLGLRQSRRALDVLKRYLDENRPTRFQKRVYRLLNWTVAGFLVGYLLVIPTVSWSSSVRAVGMGIAVVMGIAVHVAAGSIFIMVVAFLLNLGLVRKLWRLARARRELGISKSLAVAFKAQRRKRRLRNLATGGLAVLAVFYMASAIMVIAEEGEFAFTVFMAPFLLLVGLSLASIHFIRRGMERLTIVQDLYNGLSDSISAEDGEKSEIELSEDAYELLAKIERTQIIRRRQESLRYAAENPESFGYAIQTSFAAQDARSLLPVREKSLVDAAIFRLSRNPDAQGDQTGVDEDGGPQRLPVEGTSAVIHFLVDDTVQRIRIVHISSFAPEEATDEGGAS